MSFPYPPGSYGPDSVVADNDGKPTHVAGDERIRDWLASKGVDWNDVFLVTHDEHGVTIHRYDRDDSGHRFTTGDEVATLPPVLVAP